jgi:SlyX protein
MESRLDEIELKLNVAENTIDTLNQILFRQQQQIDRLQQALRALQEKVMNNDVNKSGPTDLQAEVPPHY